MASLFQITHRITSNGARRNGITQVRFAPNFKLIFKNTVQQTKILHWLTIFRALYWELMLQKRQTSMTSQNTWIMIIWCAMSINWCRIQSAMNTIKFQGIIYCTWQIQREQRLYSKNSSLTSLNLCLLTPSLTILINFNQFDRKRHLNVWLKNVAQKNVLEII